MVSVRAYEKADGTQVRAHARSAPGGSRQIAILGTLVLAFVAMANLGSSNAAHSEGQAPRPLVHKNSGGGQQDVPVIRITVPKYAPAGSR